MKKTMKSISIFLTVIFCLTSVFPPSARAAEDIYYLEKELEEQKNIYLPLVDSAKNMEIFLFEYPMRREDLVNVHKELTAHEGALKQTLHSNLVKSTIALGIDTAGKINFAVGLYMKSLKIILLSVVVEAAGDYMQGSFSTPYGGAVRKLSDDALKIMPELQKFQFMLSLSAGEWRALMRMQGEFEDDQEKGMLYRRFHDILEELDKHKRKLEALIREFDNTQKTIEAEYPGVREKRDALEKKIKDLEARLSTAMEEKKKEDIDASLQKAQNKAGKQKPPSLPAIQLTGDKKKDLEAWEVKYDEADAIINAQLPPLYEEVARMRKKVSKDLQEAGQEMKANELSSGYDQRRNSYYSSYFSVPDEVNPALDYSVEQIVDIHMQSKGSLEYYQNMAPDVRSAMGKMGAIEQEGMDLAVKEKQLVNLIDMGSAVQDEYRSIMPGSIDHSRNIFTLFRKIMPDFQNFNRELTGLQYVATAASTRSDLEIVEAELPLAIEITSKNVKTCAKMFDGKKMAYDEVYSKFSEYYTNMYNAFQQLEGTVEAYEKIVSGSKWDVGRSSSDNEHYFSPLKGSFTALLTKVFSENKFSKSLVSAMEEGDYSGAEEIVSKYNELRDKWVGLDHKYTTAWNHYFYYMDQLGTVNTSVIWQMDAASKVEGALLKAPPIKKEDYSNLQGGVAKYDPVFKTLQELPFIDVDASSSGGKALKIYEIWETIKNEKGSWLSLNQKDFLVKYNDMASQLEKASEGSDLKSAVSAIKMELSDINQEWYKKHPQPAPPAGGGDDGKKKTAVPLIYNITNTRINKKPAESSSGTFVIIKDDLTKGAIELVGRLDNMKGVKKIMISENGLEWSDLPLKDVITYTFYPVADKYYRPVLRLRLDDGSEQRIEMFPQLTGIVYKDIDATRLVVEAVQFLAEAYEARNASRFLDIVSRDFLGNRVYLEEGVRFDFDMFSDIRLSIFINRIDQGKDAYTAETKWDKTQIPRKTGSQQRTSGNTTLVFAMEDGKMKLKNMRGNLIYATLSPEIAESSGLNSKVVEEITIARNNRIPSQPGAGETEESGGVGSNIENGTTSLTQSSAHGPLTNQGYTFSSKQVVTEDASMMDDTNADFKRREGYLMVRSGNGVQSLGSVDLDSVTEVPTGGYAAGEIGFNESQTYAISISDGRYAIIRVTSSNEGAWPMTTNYRFKYQKSGTRSFQ